MKGYDINDNHFKHHFDGQITKLYSPLRFQRQMYQLFCKKPGLARGPFLLQETGNGETEMTTTKSNAFPLIFNFS